LGEIFSAELKYSIRSNCLLMVSTNRFPALCGIILTQIWAANVIKYYKTLILSRHTKPAGGVIHLSDHAILLFGRVKILSGSRDSESGHQEIQSDWLKTLSGW
jgi:hypothetical protein